MVSMQLNVMFMFGLSSFTRLFWSTELC